MEEAEYELGDFGGGEHIKKSGSNDCFGRRIKGKRISYRSNQGFIGTDFLEFEASFEFHKPILVKYTLKSE